MEDADKVSSSTPDELLGNEPVAARGESVSPGEKTIRRRPHTHEESSSHTEGNVTPPITEEIITPPITIEVITSMITIESITPPITEEMITPLITDEIITPPITEEVITPPITEEVITPPITEVITPPITEEVITPPITEEVITPSRTEEIITPPIIEESFTPTEIKTSTKTTETTASPQETELTSMAQRTEESIEREVPERSLQDSEASCVSQIAEVSAAGIELDVQTQHQTLTSEDIQEKRPYRIRHLPSSYVPAPAAAPQFSTDHLSSSAVDSQDRANLTMDLFSQNSAGVDPDVLNQLDDDFKFEIKNNSFRTFSPIRDAASSVEVSDSPSPDLVQDAYDGDDDVTRPQEIKPIFDSDLPMSYSHVQQLASSDLISNVNKEADDRPTSLPDILKSSPLNPEKVDSGSSEGSPDLSPAHRSGSDSPNSPISVSANNPFGFDSKILLLKEMAEETEARAAEKTEHIFVAFDLVKETEVPLNSEQLLKVKDAELSVQMNDKFECLHFPTGKAQEHWDSESPSADSFSPVLEAVAKRPVEHENAAVMEEIEAIDEVSEQEISSEEFEFVERPPQGATNDFMEIQDSGTFYEEQSSDLEPSSAPDTEDQSSFYHLSQMSDEVSPVRVKATGLETTFQASPIHTAEHQSGLKSEVSSLCSLRALDLVYWRDVRSSAVVFSSSLVLLLSLSCCSVVSVMAYTALALLSLTVTFRIYKAILQAIQKSDEGHPFKHYLDKDVALSMDVVQKYSDMALSQINGGLIQLQHLFLVEDLVDSLKFAVFLWILTYVGAVFNGLTLVILGLVGSFSCPVIYEKHQAEINEYISMVKKPMKDFLGMIQAKVPGIKKLE